jgi:hypothetical protein
VELKRDFPLGYCLFGITGDRRVVEGSGTLADNFRIVWHEARILQVTEKGEVTMRLPDIHSIQPGDNSQLVGAQATLVPRGTRFTPFAVSFGGSLVGLKAEHFTNTADGMIAVIGLYDVKARFPNFPDTRE